MAGSTFHFLVSPLTVPSSQRGSQALMRGLSSPLTLAIPGARPLANFPLWHRHRGRSRDVGFAGVALDGHGVGAGVDGGAEGVAAAKEVGVEGVAEGVRALVLEVQSRIRERGTIDEIDRGVLRIEKRHGWPETA